MAGTNGIELIGLRKTFPNGHEAVKGIDFSAGEKDFTVFVGPSGCGKTTTLRMIAGLEDVSGGEIRIGGRTVNRLAPKDRDIAMVFQNYALYPHMTVYKNISFGLELRKTQKQELDRRVREAASMLGIEHLLDRRPNMLSGGERQRAAIGRAIVREPKIFLMDEPLSNLDAKLRTQMRAEIARLHRKLGTAFIYVTHDQTEAMTLGTRIVVMKDGEIQQAGTPLELYNHPANVFVAGFIGSPQMNFFDAEIADGGIWLGQHRLETSREIPNARRYGKEITLGLRPKDIHVTRRLKLGIAATIDQLEHLGSETQLGMSISGTKHRCTAVVDPGFQAAYGGEVSLAFDMESARLFDAEGKAIPWNI